jgi:hypothetical protein
LSPYIYKPVAVCNEIEEPVTIPVQFSIILRKNELPDLGNEQNPTL